MIASLFAIKFIPFTFAACTTIKDVNAGPFFFLPPWWQYLPEGSVELDALGQCVPTFIFPDHLLPIGLAVLDMLLRVAGFLAVISIIVSGLMYILASGNPEKAASARGRIYNSFIGLAIALTATAIVTFLGRSLGG